MRTLEAIRGTIAKLGGLTQRRRQPDFSCGECERWQRCGLPPSKQCIVMAAQIARDGRRSTKRDPVVHW